MNDHIIGNGFNDSNENQEKATSKEFIEKEILSSDSEEELDKAYKRALNDAQIGTNYDPHFSDNIELQIQEK